jgi:putative acetyltransferase
MEPSPYGAREMPRPGRRPASVLDADRYVGPVEVVVGVDDPRVSDVRALLERHLAFAHEVTPPGHVHALGIDGLLDADVMFFSARRDGVLLGVGALKRLDAEHAELKSMHTTAAARRQGVGRAMVAHLLLVATTRNYRRVSLETGTGEEFAPAHALYEGCGFVRCEPFGEYTRNPHSVCMTLEIS